MSNLNFRQLKQSNDFNFSDDEPQPTALDIAQYQLAAIYYDHNVSDEAQLSIDHIVECMYRSLTK